MVTAKPKKTVAKKTIKKPVKPVVEQKKLSFYHDAFKVIAWASKLKNLGDKEKNIWTYSGAIRGPDTESEPLKNVTTAIVRGYSPYGNDVHAGRFIGNPDAKTLETLLNEEPTTHFKRHVAGAFGVLASYYTQSGKKEEGLVFHSLGGKLMVGSCKEYLEQVKIVLDNWDDSLEED